MFTPTVIVLFLFGFFRISQYSPISRYTVWLMFPRNLNLLIYWLLCGFWLLENARYPELVKMNKHNSPLVVEISNNRWDEVLTLILMCVVIFGDKL